MPYKNRRVPLRLGTTLHTRCFTLVYFSKDKVEIKNPFVGFVIPKRLFKKATDRNFLKRRMRGIFAMLLKEKSFAEDSLLFIYKKDSVLESSEIEKEFRVFLEKIYANE